MSWYVRVYMVVRTVKTSEKHVARGGESKDMTSGVPGWDENINRTPKGSENRVGMSEGAGCWEQKHDVRGMEEG